MKSMAVSSGGCISGCEHRVVENLHGFATAKGLAGHLTHAVRGAGDEHLGSEDTGHVECLDRRPAPALPRRQTVDHEPGSPVAAGGSLINRTGHRAWSNGEPSCGCGPWPGSGAGSARSSSSGSQADSIRPGRRWCASAALLTRQTGRGPGRRRPIAGAGAGTRGRRTEAAPVRTSSQLEHWQVAGPEPSCRTRVSRRHRATNGEGAASSWRSLELENTAKRRNRVRPSNTEER